MFFFFQTFEHTLLHSTKFQFFYPHFSKKWRAKSTTKERIPLDAKPKPSPKLVSPTIINITWSPLKSSLTVTKTEQHRKPFKTHPNWETNSNPDYRRLKENKERKNSQSSWKEPTGSETQHWGQWQCFWDSGLYSKGDKRGTM